MKMCFLNLDFGDNNLNVKGNNIIFQYQFFFHFSIYLHGFLPPKVYGDRFSCVSIVAHIRVSYVHWFQAWDSISVAFVISSFMISSISGKWCLVNLIRFNKDFISFKVLGSVER